MGLRQNTLVRRTHRYWHAAFFAAVLFSVFLVVQGLGRVLTPVVAAMILAYLLDPLVTGMEARLRLPRWLGTLVIVLVGVSAITTLLVILVPVVAREVEVFGGTLEKLPVTVLPWIERTFHVELPHSLKDLWARFGVELRGAAGSVFGSLSGVAGNVAKGTVGLFNVVGDAASALGSAGLAVVFTLYFLPHFPSLVSGARELIPFRYRRWVDGAASEINAALAAWMRGQLTVMATLAALYALGLKFVAHLEMAVLIGLLTGMLAFIPYVGFALGLVAALLVCVLRSGGPELSQLVETVAVFGVVQVIDGLFLTPRIVGEKAGIGPVGVLVALLVGGKVFGFVGVLLAVPVSAALVILLRRGLEAYRASLFFCRGQEGLPSEPTLPLSADVAGETERGAR